MGVNERNTIEYFNFKDYSSTNLTGNNGFSRVDVEEFNPGSRRLPNSAYFRRTVVILEDSFRSCFAGR